jgi:hypothetical protein
MINPATIYLGAANASFSGMALLFLLPIAVVIYLDIKFVNWSIRKEGRARFFALAISFVLSLGAVGWGIWSIFTAFSLALLFIAVGGGILLLFSVRSAATDKDDLKHER